MRILVTNDDGIRAPGIYALARSLSTEHEVIVAAPERERSGVGHSFTYLRPLFITPYEMDDIAAYAISGTPVDCVKLGIHSIANNQIDMIVSGINCGANLGSDVLYSGTASAALEGALQDLPSIAISCNSFNPKDYSPTADFALKAVAYLQAHPLPRHTMLNINVPDMEKEQIKGTKITPLGEMNYINRYEERCNPRGCKYYWIDDQQRSASEGDTDVYWQSQGYITLSPVMADLTNHQWLATMKSHNFFEVE